MPTYEYECSKCGHQFEIFQSMKDKALTTCPKPKCKGKVKRLLGSGAGLIFKGSGFYITDYRSEGYKQAAKKDSGGGESKSTTSENKPASGGEKKTSTPAAAPAKKESKAKS